MGPLFVLLLWALAALIVAAGTVLTWRSARPRRLIVRCAILAIPTLLLGVPVTLLLAGGVLTSLEPPTAKFAAVFGMEPPPAVEEIKASEELGSDFDRLYLAFKTDAAGLAAITTELQPSADIPGQGPSWWDPSHCPGFRSYGFASHSTRRWDRKALFHCEATSQVFVVTSWID